ncbi:hypothetical protein HAX54_047922, partial [Datura stramonium]|nr:hypothetical protein [Datura stramonium]
ETLVSVLSFLEGMTQIGIATLLVARLTVIIHEEKIFDHPRRIDPPKFKGDHREDAYELLISCHKRLHNLGLKAINEANELELMRYEKFDGSRDKRIVIPVLTMTPYLKARFHGYSQRTQVMVANHVILVPLNRW